MCDELCVRVVCGMCMWYVYVCAYLCVAYVVCVCVYVCVQIRVRVCVCVSPIPLTCFHLTPQRTWRDTSTYWSVPIDGNVPEAPHEKCFHMYVCMHVYMNV